MLITFVGLSHLSLNYSAATLTMGHTVQILDSQLIINQFKNKELSFYEPGLDSTLKKYKNEINFDYNFEKLKQSDLIFVGVDVLTNNNDKVIYRRLRTLIKSSIEILKNIEIPLIIMSQVEPGFTRKIKYNKKYLYHYVETLIFGKALERAMYPERIIIGKESNKHKTQEKLAKFLMDFNCEIIEMSYEESELTKAFINIYLASQLITTNNLANIASSMNAKWEVIRKALILDKRIGRYSYTLPGLGISGGNIERDIKTLNDLSSQIKTRKFFFQHLIKDNSYFKNWLFRKITSENSTNKKIGILGITYKEDTLSVKNAASLELIKKLKLSNLYLHDRRYKNLDLSEKINKRFFDLSKILEKCDTLIILHNIKIYKNLDFRNKKISLILDPLRILKKIDSSNIRYFSISK